MKVKSVVFVLSIILASKVMAQQIPNGGFEEHYVDSLSFIGDTIPNFWKFGYDSDDCSGYLGGLTNDSHSGNWAIELETVFCSWSINGSGIYSYPQLEDPYTAADYSGFEINASPYQLSFYSKFTPVEGDTAFVYARLFNYPDTVPVTDPDALSYFEIIATVEKFIMDSSDQYTQQLLTFDYESTDTPKYISVVFLSNKNGIGLTGDEHATPGTTLLIDDVELIYLPTYLSENIAKFNVQIFPNPVQENFEIQYITEKVTSIEILDYQGRTIRSLDPQARYHSMSGLSSGVYLIRIFSESGTSWKRVVKQ